MANDEERRELRAQWHTWRAQGASVRECAQRAGVSVSTMRRALSREPENAQGAAGDTPPREDARDECGRVEAALVRRATGYAVREEKVSEEEDGKGGTKRKKERITKHMPPDVSAIMQYLKVRRPERWGGAENETKEGKLLVFSSMPRPGRGRDEGDTGESDAREPEALGTGDGEDEGEAEYED